MLRRLAPITALLLLPVSSLETTPKWGDSIKRYCAQPDYGEPSIWPDKTVPWVDGGEATNMPGTMAAQKTIWDHQHPEDCSNKKFVVGMFQRGFGFGGIILRTVKLMIHALENDAVFVAEHAPNFRW
jgi:hypothetical protein